MRVSKSGLSFLEKFDLLSSESISEMRSTCLFDKNPKVCLKDGKEKDLFSRFRLILCKYVFAVFFMQNMLRSGFVELSFVILPEIIFLLFSTSQV